MEAAAAQGQAIAEGAGADDGAAARAVAPGGPTMRARTRMKKLCIQVVIGSDEHAQILELNPDALTRPAPEVATDIMQDQRLTDAVRKLSSPPEAKPSLARRARVGKDDPHGFHRVAGVNGGKCACCLEVGFRIFASSLVHFAKAVMLGTFADLIGFEKRAATHHKSLRVGVKACTLSCFP